MHTTDKTAEYLKALGVLVRNARVDSMSQEELALRAGVSRGTVSRIEKGESVSSEALIEVLGRLGLLARYYELTNRLLNEFGSDRFRKSRVEPGRLSNDF